MSSTTAPPTPAPTASGTPLVALDRVTFGYPGAVVPIFQDFSLDLAPGDRLAVIGPSGCGKTTLLYLVAGLRQPGAGSLLVEGAPVLKPRRRTAIILQDYGLLPWATAEENVRLGLRIRGVPGREQVRIAREWLGRVGIAGLESRYPSELSGGQRQRVAIARALALSPDLLLMDEPFSALDALTREELQRVLLDLAREQGLTLILVTHSIEEAVFLGQRILVFARPPLQEGTIIDNPGSGTPDYRSSTAFYARATAVRRTVEAALQAD